MGEIVDTAVDVGHESLKAHRRVEDTVGTRYPANAGRKGLHRPLHAVHHELQPAREPVRCERARRLVPEILRGIDRCERLERLARRQVRLVVSLQVLRGKT